LQQEVTLVACFVTNRTALGLKAYQMFALIFNVEVKNIL